MQTDQERQKWAQQIKDIPISKADPDKWPPGVRHLSMDDEGLGIDKHGTLHWQGKAILVRRQFELRWFELLLATLATVATVAQAIIAIMDRISPMHQ